MGRIVVSENVSLDGVVQDPAGDEGLPKYVVSSTLDDPDWNNSTVLKGDAVDEVSKLKQGLNGGDRRRRQLPAPAHARRPRPRRRAAAEDLPAGSEEDVRKHLADDPWLGTILTVENIQLWSIWIGALPG
jgi:hypothetical protein